ncbi:hypothetical protein Axi01nite_19240 [Actinoplanes xinjiangensis]|nr:hypothetical protein Axi01nite_19240 [Actinoplanes xinjiangensis]
MEGLYLAWLGCGIWVGFGWGGGGGIAARRGRCRAGGGACPAREQVGRGGVVGEGWFVPDEGFQLGLAAGRPAAAGSRVTPGGMALIRAVGISAASAGV